MGQSLSSAFAKAVRRKREACELTQEVLAHRARLHPTYVGLIERGKRRPTIEVAQRLAKALGLKLSDLVRDAEELL